MPYAALGRTTEARISSVYAGTLDSSDSLSPVGHIWTRSAQPWVKVSPGFLDYEQEPEDMNEFTRAWKKR